MTEDDIMHENGEWWVGRDRRCYFVSRNHLTHSRTDSEYEKTPDGLTIAIARCDYLANRVLTS